MEDILKVGDTVWWSGGFGTHAEKKAVVVSVDLMVTPGIADDCVPVGYARWDNMENIVVSLDNRHWAYGYQLRPV